MSPSPLISVIMNCYNSERFLREAIASVISQDYQNWEIVFWDNQSTDASAAIVNNIIDPRIRYFKAEQHTALGEARHLATQMARGEWIALLDCDDLWLPHKLSQQVRLINQDARLGLVYSDMWLCDSNGEVIGKGSDRFRMRRGRVWEDLLSSRNFIPCPAALMKHDAVINSGGFDPALRYCEEFELFLKIARNYEVDFIAEPLVKYRIHGGNITGFGNHHTTEEYISVLQREITQASGNSQHNRLTLKSAVKSQLRLSLLRGRLLQQKLRAGLSSAFS